ncbi:LOW QUALITY PROTEIN: Endonuclease_5 domain-containing protein, partial [Cephalotus follicularis]
YCRIQDTLKKKLILEDGFDRKLPTPTEEEHVLLKYVGGVDISFSKHSNSIACGCLVVLELPSLQIEYQDFSLLTLQVPYVPSFLAFREAPVLLQLLEKLKNNAMPFYPQLLMVDGNGLLHPRGKFGLACHLGVLADLPTIGIGKSLHHVDGLTQFGVRQLLEAKENSTEDFTTLTGCSGCTWGVAMRSTLGSMKPIFISIGHRISLDTAVKIVKLTCKYRMPEPVRQVTLFESFGIKL